ncbi:MAG: hypothetical protein U0893_12875 [Chloroflexota bacterium]
MLTRSVQLSDEDAEGLRHLLAETGESEEELLRRATVRGIRDLRLELGIRAFKDGRSSGEAAAIAGLPRAIFLETLLDRGVVILGDTPSLGDQLAGLAQGLGDERMAKFARKLQAEPR